MISIIVPTYNERANIVTLIGGIHSVMKKAGHDYEVIVVDDDSPDRTWDAAGRLCGKFNVRVVRRQNERGLATAVVEGFRHASGDIIGVMDADLSHPVAALRDLIKRIEDGADIAVGSRFVSGGNIEEWPRIRGAISSVGMAFARPLTKLKDPMSGFFLMRSSVIEGVKLSPKGYKILLEILIKGKYEVCAEVPYTFLNRTFGESKIGARVYCDYLMHLASLYWYRFSKKR
mgnify:CR=1 FL=1